MTETLEHRLRRLLLLVPYVLRHSPASVKDICLKFEISKAALVSDLNLLFMCGLPGYGPGDLIEAYVDGDEVSIRLADYFSRPLRLTPAEGLLLYSGAKTLKASGNPTPALEKAIERLEEVLGRQTLDRLSLTVEPSQYLDRVKAAADKGRRLHLVYQSQSKDEVTERDVDPWAMFFSSGRWYLAGWCHLARDERIFRIDRMKEVEVLDQKSNVPEDLDLSKYQSAYVESPDATKVTLEISPEASWVLEYYPLISKTQQPDGWTRIELSAGGTVWLERLLLRLGRYARVLEPDWLGEHLRALACRMAARYSSDPAQEISALQ